MAYSYDRRQAAAGTRIPIGHGYGSYFVSAVTAHGPDPKPEVGLKVSREAVMHITPSVAKKIAALRSSLVVRTARLGSRTFRSRGLVASLSLGTANRLVLCGSKTHRGRGNRDRF